MARKDCPSWPLAPVIAIESMSVEVYALLAFWSIFSFKNLSKRMIA